VGFVYDIYVFADEAVEPDVYASCVSRCEYEVHFVAATGRFGFAFEIEAV